ncbi:AraC family transcriptional regulator [Oleiphilus messinensis]|uniref:AraC family transcriptional regulator n=1 Tax=Oleiphilus messinensis TaxID=141451 RepID=A0A1Y0IGY1_9GAMM|nr:AraC family transcriptional regulator [Oleiphilus messinensis]ARU58644.1 AraC family transcriptional regulator [Oleiphilus messinensis]
MRGHYIGSFVDVLSERGVDRAALLAFCGLTEEELTSEHLIDEHRLLILTKRSIELTGDDGLGLEVGQRLSINTHGPLGYAAMASPTYEQAVQLALKYYKLQTPRAFLDLRENGDVYEVVAQPSAILPEMPWHTSEFLLTSIFTSTRFLLSGHIDGLTVCLNYDPPPHAYRYKEVFSVPVKFNHHFTGLEIPKLLAKTSLPSADPVAATLFAQRCESLRQQGEREALVPRINQLLYECAGHFPTQAEVAGKMNMSVSTLHRKLAEQGASYKQLLSDFRRDLAIQQLQESQMTVDQIAELLGFSDASNFRRAFVNWTGKTPSDYRKSGQNTSDTVSPSKQGE